MAATGARWIALDFDWNSIQGDGPDELPLGPQHRHRRARGTRPRPEDRRHPRVQPALGPAGRLRRHEPLPARPIPPRSAASRGRGRAATAPTRRSPTFRGSVQVWQIWNEANHYPFVQPTVDIAGYTAMLRQAYPAIKTARRRRDRARRRDLTRRRRPERSRRRAGDVPPRASTRTAAADTSTRSRTTPTRIPTARSSTRRGTRSPRPRGSTR